MASGRIKGITIEIDGDTTKLTDSLKSVDKSLKDTQTKLKDVDKLLKLDPKNTELLKQKQELLNKAISDSKDKVGQLESALEQMGGRTKENAQQYDAIQREIIECEQQQKAWNAELDAMSPKVETVQDKLQSISDSTGKAAEATKGLSTAAGNAAKSLLDMATKSASDADDLLTLANQTGFTVEELQKMQYASSFIDVSMESMTGSIMKLTKNMASGSDAFKTLGISITDSNGEMRNATDVWYESLTALSQIENETERDQISMELFGKSAMEMAGIVDDGGEALKALGEEAESTGTILGKDAVESAVAFNDQMDKIKNTATQAFFSAGAALADTLFPALERLTEVIVEVLSWFGTLDGDTQAFILTILGLVAAISPVLGIISAITGAAAALNVAVLPMIATIAGIVVGIAALVAAGVWLYQNWDLVKAKAIELWNSLTATFNSIVANITTAWTNIVTTVTTFVTNLVTTVRTWFETMATAIAGKVNDAKTAATNAFNALKTGITNAVNGALTTVKTVFESIRSSVKEKVDAAKEAASNAFEGVKNAIKTKLDAAFDIVKGIVDKIKGAFNFTWKLPDLKVPTVKVTGGEPPFGIGGKGSLPHFEVLWNKRGYFDGVLFNSPTVLPTVNGLQGFGDGNGAELVIGLNRLRDLVASSSPGNVNVNVYAAQGMSEAQIANAVALKLDRWLGSRL